MLRRVTGGEVPEVLAKARVVEVLAHLNDIVGSSIPEYDRGWRDCVASARSMLGLTLPTGSDDAQRDPRQLDDGQPLSADDLDRIDAAWERHREPRGPGGGEPTRPVANCGHVNAGDGLCAHPSNLTPECHEHACPLVRTRARIAPTPRPEGPALAEDTSATCRDCGKTRGG